MNSKRIDSENESRQAITNRAEDDPFFVPNERTALVIRNGVPEQFMLPGYHALPQGEDKVEVRLLSPEASRLPALAPPDTKALALPFERSFLHLNGNLVGILEPSPTEPAIAAPDIKAWEGFNPDREVRVRYLESLKACLSEPLRACYPASGICCGARSTNLASP